VVELKVVPDPLAFPPKVNPWQWNSAMNRYPTRTLIEVQNSLDILIQQARAGMISMSELRAREGL
jgi:hypothetical protein